MSSDQRIRELEAEVERLREHLATIRQTTVARLCAARDLAEAEVVRLRKRLASCEEHYESHASDDYGAWLREVYPSCDD